MAWVLCLEECDENIDTSITILKLNLKHTFSKLKNRNKATGHFRVRWFCFGVTRRGC
jgi:hypothetical protein